MNTLFGQETNSQEATPIPAVADPTPTRATGRAAASSAAGVLVSSERVGGAVLGGSISYFAADNCPCEAKTQKKPAACCCAEVKSAKGCCCATAKTASSCCCEKPVAAAKGGATKSGCLDCCSVVAKAACACSDCCCAKGCKCDKNKCSCKDCCCTKGCACGEKPKTKVQAACACGKTCACCDCKPATRKAPTKTVLLPAPPIDWVVSPVSPDCPVVGVPHLRVMPGPGLRHGVPMLPFAAGPFHHGIPHGIHHGIHPGIHYGIAMPSPPQIMPPAEPMPNFHPASLPRMVPPPPQQEGPQTAPATSSGVRLFLDGIEVHCHRLTCSGEHIVLEGDVRISYEIHGKHVRLHGQRVIMNPLNGSLQVEGGTSVNTTAYPATAPTCPPAATWAPKPIQQPTSYSAPAARPMQATPISTQPPSSRTAPCRADGDCQGRTELPPKSTDDELFIFWLNMFR